RWDPPMSKDGEPIVGYWDNDNQWVPYAFLAPGDNPPVDMTADSKGDVTPLEQKLPPLETKPWTSLQKVLQEHADESKKLEIALQGTSDMISSSYRWPYDSWLIIFLCEVEHARQTQDIQRRKAQRRKERKVKKAAAHDGGDAKTLVAPPPPVDLSALNALTGYGISGHKNSFNTGVKIGNYVEDQYGAKLAQESVACAMNGISEMRAKFVDPQTQQSRETVAPSTDDLTESYVRQNGLSYNLLFPHGPEGKEGKSIDWCTTNQLLHGPAHVQSRSVFENGSSIGLAHIDARNRNDKAVELQKKLAREKRLQQSYMSTTQASSALVRKAS
ncbi:hypothetical protein DYB28_013251, partial [Aphanomyces astaci]